MNLESIIPWKKEESQLTRRRQETNPIALFQRKMNSLFDDFFGGSSSEFWNGSENGLAPNIDVNDSGKEVRISAELPGLGEKDVKLSLCGDLLTIEGEKKEEQEEEKADFYHSERSYGYFKRAVQLPSGVDADKAQARFKKGLLKVTIPKKPEAQSRRRKIDLIEG